MISKEMSIFKSTLIDAALNSLAIPGVYDREAASSSPL